MQTSPDETGHRVYAFEGFTLNATSRSLKSGNCDLELRPKSFDVLCCLVEHAGELVPKDEILRKVWSGIHVTDESLARCVSDAGAPEHQRVSGSQRILVIGLRPRVCRSPTRQPMPLST